MKKHYLSLATSLFLGVASASAIPACPDPGTVTQPDGTQLTVRLYGDEFLSYTTTVDGYTVMRAADGSYRYAVADAEGNLVPGDITAHNAGARDAQEQAYLMTIEKKARPQMSAVQQQMRADRFGNHQRFLANGKTWYDYHNFRGLVILVQFNDRSFSVDDPVSLFGDMVTRQNYTGFNHNGSFQQYTGSVRDYFYDNSTHQFDPEFDIKGPVTISHSQYDVDRTNNIRTIINDALTKLDPDIDYSLYDTDHDGKVDMFYVIFAGGGSNFSGNDERLVWPHAWDMGGSRYDGVAMGRYACSTELYGPPSWNWIDGIGTICHEFSHVLGLMDEYDTDYEGGGGQADHPGDWSLMASAGYLNYSRTPAGYTLMQRFQSGFCNPIVINEAGDYTLESIDEINNGYRINTSDPKEYFLLENHRKTKWNEYTKGEGMLIHRVDSTNPSIWASNQINANPAHTYYELLRAHRIGAAGGGAADHAGDPFPGEYNVTEINYDTTPNLKAWSGKGAAFTIKDIAETEDGKITFTTVKEELTEKQETFEDMETSGKYDQNVQGSYTTWSFYNGGIDDMDSKFGMGKSAGIFKGGTITTGVIEGHTNAISVTFANNANLPVTVNLRYNTGGNNWDFLTVPGGTGGIAIPRDGTATYRFDIPADYRDNLKLQVRLANNSGSNTGKVYVDNFIVMQKPGQGSGVETVNGGDATLAMSWIMDGSTLSVSAADGTEVRVCDITGLQVGCAKAAGGKAVFNLPSRGIYIVSNGSEALKVLY